MIRLSDIFVKNRETGKKYDVKKVNPEKHEFAYDYRGSKENPNPFQKEKPKKVKEGWSQKYKKSINCSNPKGFSQKAHCAGKKKKKNENMKKVLTVEQKMELFLEKNCPTDPGKWAASKAAAKKKFDVYPSAYANGWAAKNYKGKGGSWRKCKG